ncbi:hypothetical protein [Streptosporangium sp. NPDC049376]
MKNPLSALLDLLSIALPGLPGTETKPQPPGAPLKPPTSTAPPENRENL